MSKKIKENCVVCCAFCNQIKGSLLTYNEMLSLKPMLIKIQHERNLSPQI